MRSKDIRRMATLVVTALVIAQAAEAAELNEREAISYLRMPDVGIDEATRSLSSGHLTLPILRRLAFVGTDAQGEPLPPKVRSVSIAALGAAKDEASFNLLRQYAAHENRELRQSAYIGLGRWAEPKTFDVLLDRLDKAHDDPAIFTLLTQLARDSRPGIRPRLEVFANMDSRARVREHVSKVLSQPPPK